MNKSEKVFNYVKTDEDGKGMYEASFQLPDDGCPNSEQFLRVRVFVPLHGSPEINLDLMTSGGEKRTPLGFTTASIDAVGRLLYKSARLVTKKSIEPA